MSDPTPDLDELLSAAIDGQATAEELARIEADPALQRRRDQLQRAAAQVREAVPPAPAADRERAIAAALAASATPAAGDRAQVVPFARRRRWALVSAAAVLLLAIAVIGLERGRSSTTTSTAARNASAPPAASAETKAEADAATGAAGAGAATGPLAASGLGDLPTLDALVAAVRAPAPPSAAAADGSPFAADESALACPLPDLGADRVERWEPASVAGAPVQVLVTVAPDGTRTVTVLGARCEVLRRQAL